jgi:hypothetical protein
MEPVPRSSEDARPDGPDHGPNSGQRPRLPRPEGDLDECRTVLRHRALNARPDYAGMSLRRSEEQGERGYGLDRDHVTSP